MSTGPRTNKDLIGTGDVRVVNEFGEMIGVVPVERALFMARSRKLDLVEVNPRAQPPVCKIMDFSRFTYEGVKRRRRAAANIAYARFSMGDYGELDDGGATWRVGVTLREIERTILSSPLEYGTEFRLAAPGREMIVALSTWGPVDGDDPGRFIIYVGGELIAQDANRRDVVDWIERLLA